MHVRRDAILATEASLRARAKAHRVLKDHGQFLLWDVRIPRTEKKHRQAIMPLQIQLPDGKVGIGYGVK